MTKLPPRGSDKFDDLMMEARGLAAKHAHERGECDETFCLYCERVWHDIEAEAGAICDICGQPIYRGNVCRGCWNES